jgi:hypothetical protein
MDINIINKKLVIKYYKSIQSTLSKNNINYMWLDDIINNIINNITNEKQETITKSETDSNESTHEDLYKKPWNKLNAIHKIIKIKEYINNIKNITIDEQVELRDKLCGLVRTKVLSKKEKVNYDSDKGKIISLINLEYKDGKYIYLTE